MSSYGRCTSCEKKNVIKKFADAILANNLLDETEYNISAMNLGYSYELKDQWTRHGLEYSDGLR